MAVKGRHEANGHLGRLAESAWKVSRIFPGDRCEYDDLALTSSNQMIPDYRELIWFSQHKKQNIQTN